MLIEEERPEQRSILEVLLSDEERRIMNMADAPKPTDPTKPPHHGHHPGKHHDAGGNPAPLPPGATTPVSDPDPAAVDPKPTGPPSPPAEAVTDDDGRGAD